MAQLFSSRATAIFRTVLVLAPLTAAGAGALGYIWSHSDAAWNVGRPAPQPIPFRHDVHAGALGIACRYCHSGVQRAASAGMPSAETCMTCHSQVWAGASVLEPLRTALAFNQPVVWRSVSRLPDYAFFHHGAHVSNGVACETCHGRVDQMPRTVKAQTLSMGWCLECHRDPAPHLRSHAAVPATGRTPDAGAAPETLRRPDIEPVQLLTSCSTCHR